MTRASSSRKATTATTNVQTEAPPAAPEAVTTAAPAGAAAETPRLGVGWKLALLVWALAFVGLAGFEVFGLVYKLLFR